MLIDSHCHLNSLDLSEFNQSLEKVMQDARANDVGHMLSVCVELEDVPALKNIANQYSNVNFSVGVHPNTEMLQEPQLEALVLLSDHPACIAIGETGLDYYRTVTDTAQTQQRTRFRTHIQAALQTGKPLIIHTRQAAEDTLQVMIEEAAADIGGVMHCFSETWEIAKRALDLNFYISFSGIVTFKNATALQEVAKKVPLDRMLIETDSPYLAPVPFRGQQNHPALVKYVAQRLSELRQVDYEEIAAVTTENFYRCFRVCA